MAAIETLSDKAIRAAIKVAKDVGKATTVADGGGLSLQVQASGTGWWRLRYWIASRENRLSLGTYPEVTLADARKRRAEARKQSGLWQHEQWPRLPCLYRGQRLARWRFVEPLLAAV